MSRAQHTGKFPPESADAGHQIEPGASPRARLWASTMKGNIDAGTDRVVIAHGDSGISIGKRPVRSREQRESEEALLLVDGATRAYGSGERACAELPDPLRTCFERDRDRIIHSSAFRRLAGKTQVFIFPDDHQRTRLTHALEVAQVATAISSSLQLNVALTEAIALGHDCGHGPGGHPSEDALSQYLDNGFDHAPFGADVVLRPLNLCVETLDGVRNHSWSCPAPATPEGEVVSWADRIAYVCHDWQDAKSAGIVSDVDLPSVVAERCGQTQARQISSFIHAMIEGVKQSSKIAMTKDHAEALAAFRATNYERIYLRPESLEQARRVRQLLEALVEVYASDPSLLPSGLDVDHSRSTQAFVSAVTYVAGMTDRFAVDAALSLLTLSDEQLPRPVSTTRIS